MLCKYEGCERKARARGWCDMHYQRWLRHGDPSIIKDVAATIKEKYGSNFYSRNGAIGGRVRTRGYFGKLKDEGKDAQLRKLAKEGATKSSATKPGARKNKAHGGRRNTPIPRG